MHLVGHVSNEELTALYDVADLFLSASEHEGFCVPLIEAFHKRIPIVAFAATAVPDTMDGGGVLYDRKDPRYVASIMHTVLSDEALQNQILESQDAALERLQDRDFGATLLGYVNQIEQLPHGPQPRVVARLLETVRVVRTLGRNPSKSPIRVSGATRRRGRRPTLT